MTTIVNEKRSASMGASFLSLQSFVTYAIINSGKEVFSLLNHHKVRILAFSDSEAILLLDSLRQYVARNEEETLRAELLRQRILDSENVSRETSSLYGKGGFTQNGNT